MRRSQIVGPIQEGVYAAGDYQVTQRAAGGAARFVDIAAGAGAFAVVQGDALTGQGLYVVGPHSAAVITEAIATPDVTNPRIDIAVLEVFDNTLDASGLNIARVRIIAGTPTAGTTLNSRAGVAALPGSALLLADILVTANAASVSNTQIRDRRKWARGAHWMSVGTNAGDYTTAGTAFALIGNLEFRLETSGAPLNIRIAGVWAHSLAGGSLFIASFIDGLEKRRTSRLATTAGLQTAVVLDETFSNVAAGSHLFDVEVTQSGGGTLTLVNSGTVVPTYTVREMVAQFSVNNIGTSG